MTIMKHIFAFLFMLMSFVSVWAQSDKTVGWTYVYHASTNESLEQAKRNAVSCAKVEALRKEFGSVLSGASATSLITKNNITKSKFVSIGGEGDVNGEWIADLEEPKTIVIMEEGGFCVTATVKGKAREITNNVIGFEAKILRNTPDLAYESEEFTAGNKFFVHFTSPVDGFLSIYLLDFDDETAYCLLPYVDDKDGMYPIEHGKDYYFFSREKYNEGESMRDIYEYKVATEDGQPDLNQFYFIFSPQKFTKAGDKIRKTDDGTIYPPELSWTNFQKWIMRTRSKDKEMSVQTKYIVSKPLDN